MGIPELEKVGYFIISRISDDLNIFIALHSSAVVFTLS